jgi:hypothetical protein
MAASTVLVIDDEPRIVQNRVFYPYAGCPCLRRARQVD